jgi:hypothetical protein
MEVWRTKRSLRWAILAAFAAGAGTISLAPLGGPASGQTPPAPAAAKKPPQAPSKSPPEKPANNDAEKKQQVAPVPQLPAGEAPQATEFPALLHARQAGISACTDTLSRVLPQTNDAPHEAVSFWSPEQADDHLFGSIAGLRYAQPAAPRGAAIVLAAKTNATKCDGAGVQIVPSARACGAIQAALLTGGRAIANLSGLPLIQNERGIRFLLLPSAGNGCVIISVNVLYAR